MFDLRVCGLLVVVLELKCHDLATNILLVLNTIKVLIKNLLIMKSLHLVSILERKFSEILYLKIETSITFIVYFLLNREIFCIDFH